jgi:hypothetical protein
MLGGLDFNISNLPLGEFYPADYSIACSYCGNFDYTRFDYNVGTDVCTCMECGEVLTEMHWNDLMACSAYVEPGMEPEQPQESVVSKSFKGTYHRRAYLMERLSAACLREPDINDDDKRKIISEYEAYSQQSWFHKQRYNKRIIDKRDIQSILRSLNKKNNTKLFTTRYLEKWKSIKVLLGGTVKVYTPEQLAKVGAKLMQFSGKWDFMQPASDQEKRLHWYFKNRKDFPSVNYMIRLIHRELGIKGMDGDFPVPITVSSLKQLRRYTRKLLPNDQPAFVQQTLEKFVSK